MGPAKTATVADGFYQSIDGWLPCLLSAARFSTSRNLTLIGSGLPTCTPFVW